MKRLPILRSIAVAALVTFSASSAAFADAFDDAVETVYAQYRVALFKTNSNAADEAARATAAAVTGWKDVEGRFAASPPAAYAGDPAFADTLTKIGAVLGKSQAEIGAGKLAEAHEELEAVRDLLGDLRHRNGQINWHDHINAYHSAMEAVLTAKLTPDALTSDAIEGFKEQVGVLRYLWQRLTTEAPETLRSTPEFKALIGANKAAIDAFSAALRSGDPAAISKSGAALKPPYAKLFVTFG